MRTATLRRLLHPPLVGRRALIVGTAVVFLFKEKLRGVVAYPTLHDAMDGAARWLNSEPDPVRDNVFIRTRAHLHMSKQWHPYLWWTDPSEPEGDQP